MRDADFALIHDWCQGRQDPSLSATVLVRVAAAEGGQLVLAGLESDGVPTAELLRSIPVGRIEAAANAQLTIVDDTVLTAAPPAGRHAPTAARDPRLVTGGWEERDPQVATPRPARTRPAPAAGRGRP